MTTMLTFVLTKRSDLHDSRFIGQFRSVTVSQVNKGVI